LDQALSDYKGAENEEKFDAILIKPLLFGTLGMSEQGYYFAPRFIHPDPNRQYNPGLRIYQHSG
jgi:hypothetical protein